DPEPGPARASWDRSRILQELVGPQAGDLGLLGRRDPELPLGVVREPRFEDREHLGRGLPRGTDDENIAEALLVGAVRARERLERGLGGNRGASLLPAGP